MQIADWIVLIGTITFITAYGIYKTRHQRDVKSYLLSKEMKWYTIGLSIMATQASAITFLSTPGQAFSDGMRFVQFYFGLPLAMVVLSLTVVPIYHRLSVYTAYEYLESRFDFKTRALGAFLFLTQRGLAAGLTIYAPALILSHILNWNIYYVNIAIGGIVILYTVVGGTSAVSQTQKQQMLVIFLGMLLAGIMVVQLLPTEVSFMDAVQVAGKSGKLNTITFEFDLNDKYNIWSGLLGGFFLFMSYFGTDQSQVQRYLGGRSITESRLGLLMNGFIKIPMQFLILFIGTMIFVFYQFNEPPLFFNRVEVQEVYQTADKNRFQELETQYTENFNRKKDNTIALVEALHSENSEQINQATEKLQNTENQAKKIRKEAISIIHEKNKRDGKEKSADTNYVFLTFVTQNLPTGLVGLLIAVILSASMSSTSSELNALASTTVIDIYKTSIKPNASDQHYLQVSKITTVLWGIYAISLAQFANSLSNNLIEAVNILGSLFYGTILGIFLVAFYLKKIQGNAVFYGAILAELIVLALHFYIPEAYKVAYLWYNLIGCVAVIGFALVLNPIFKMKK